MIDRIGVELEGGWESRPANATGDGSVSVAAPFRGESVSPAYRRVGHLLNYIRENYPTVVNDTCGFHVHISTETPTEYSLLMSDKFIGEAYQFWGAWGRRVGLPKNHRFWERYANGNTYCQVNSPIDVMTQSRAMSKDRARYRFLNYCYSLHGTAELRLLPQFKKADTACQAVTEWHEFVGTYLARAQRDFSVALPIVFDESEYIVTRSTTNRITSDLEVDSIPVGTRVRVTGEFDGRTFEGALGTVRVAALDGENLGVAFDDRVGGHNLHGHCEEGHGWFLWGISQDSYVEVVS